MQVGEYKIDISVQFNGQGSHYALANSPYMAKVHVTTTDPSKTVLSGTGKTNAVAGVRGHFEVILFDEGGNQQQMGGDQISVKIMALPSLASQITTVEVFDMNYGTYNVNYEILDSSFDYLVTVVVNEDTANAKTSTISVVPNVPDPLKSTRTANSPLTIAQDHTFNH